MGKKRPGVKARETSIQIWFNWEGRRVWETLDWFPSEANLDKAARLRDRVKTLADAGALDYGEFFPGSPRSGQGRRQAPRLYDVAQDWLASLSVLNDTLRDYKRIMNRQWADLLPLPVDEITFAHINACIVAGGLNGKSPKYFNNEIGPLKALFKFAVKTGVITANPCDLLDYRRLVRDDPDPFDREETERIISYFYQHTKWGNYFESAFFTGMRNPSELIALPVENIDFAKCYARVDRATSRGTTKDHTKTRVTRDVHLNPRAATALRAERNKHPTGTGPIFRHPSTGDVIFSGEVQNDIWRTALAVLGIRHRPMKNTRHTYATFLLEEGINPAIAANELGHSVQVFLTVYAKWINKEKTREEHTKIDKAAGQRVAKSVAEDPDRIAKLLILK